MGCDIWKDKNLLLRKITLGILIVSIIAFIGSLATVGFAQGFIAYLALVIGFVLLWLVAIANLIIRISKKG